MKNETYPIFRFTVDKANYDGVQTSIVIKDGVPIYIETCGKNVPNGYVPRHQWDAIDPEWLSMFRIKEYTEAVERMDGHILEIRDDGAPEVKRNAEYYRGLKREAVFDADLFIRTKQHGDTIVNIIDPGGNRILTSFDEHGNYIKS